MEDEQLPEGELDAIPPETAEPQGPEVEFLDSEDRLNNFIATARGMNYRPVCLTVVTRHNAEGQQEFLLSESVYGENGGSWAPPQGGIEEDETIDEGIIRELDEEHFLGKDITRIRVGITEPTSVAYTPDRKGEEERDKGRGHDGKAYVTAHVELPPGTTASFNPDESRGVAFLSADEAIKKIEETHQEPDKAVKMHLAIEAIQAVQNMEAVSV